MYIGVDIGTSVIKAAAFDDDGRQVALEARKTRLFSPHEGWIEQDLDEVVATVAEVIRALVATAGQAPELIGMTGQGDGVWLVDESGRAVRPAVSWMDARAAGIVHEWLGNGVVDQAFRRSGGAIFPGCPAPVLAWFDRHEPATLDRAVTAGYCKDAVMQRLTGVRATDASDASLPFLDPHSRGYADELLQLCGLQHRRDLLAPVIEPCPTGTVTPEAAELLGVPAGTPVSSGPFDLPACALGSGVLEPGEGHLIVGTTLVCQVVIDEIQTDGEPAGLTVAYGPNRWLRAMPAMVGTAALDWVLATIGETHANVDAMLAESPPGARGVSCLPYFSPAGERAPFVEPGARARFDGMTTQTTKADLVRATCEAVGYAARHCFEAAGLRDDVAICGGGAKSSGWLHLFADVLGKQVRAAGREEVGAYGAVLAGFQAYGRQERLNAGGFGTDVTGPTVQPNQDLTDHYAQGYAKYRKAVDRARAEWKESSRS
jgi:erythritol kinase (D-erythritol 1-phosphate-forming)